MGWATTPRKGIPGSGRLSGARWLCDRAPDGYLAWALSGNTQQRVGPVALKDGALRAGPFEVGAFYDGRSGAFFPVDERLERARSHPPLAEVYDDGDVINRTLDGAEDAFRDTVLALGGLVFHPGDSLAALSQLP
ncbi:hypothetical protein [Archangium sp.]|uniref:hypothetical protein n=1 Tax=Archangium sp. TaxID=1872627 RepID=UPI002D73A767|nr:hypothetical protein [Archangium sp.]HYO52919.1 hypothetical protein [Archangium sp.]